MNYNLTKFNVVYNHMKFVISYYSSICINITLGSELTSSMNKFFVYYNILTEFG